MFWIDFPWRTQILILMTYICGFYWLLWKDCGFMFCPLSLWSSVCAWAVGQELNRQSSLRCLNTYRFKCPTFLCMDDEWRIRICHAVYGPLTYILVDWFMDKCLVFVSSSLMWIVNDKPLSEMTVPWRTQLLISMTSMCGFYWLLWKVCGFILCHLSL